MKKAKENGTALNFEKEIKITEKIERGLIVDVLQFPNAVIRSVESYRPNIIADYIYEVAKRFNTFYNSLPILKEKEEVLYSRLQIASLVAETLKTGLSLLGIDTVERM